MEWAVTILPSLILTVVLALGIPALLAAKKEARKARVREEEARVREEEARVREEELMKEKEKFFFEKGLPRLCKLGQKSSSSASKVGDDRKSKYPTVRVVAAKFEACGTSLTCGIPAVIRMKYYQEGTADGLSWTSEASVQSLVSLVITDAIRAAQLHRVLKVDTEITISNMQMLENFVPNMRGDIWVVSKQGYPIGVVEVKKKHRKYSLNDEQNWRSLYEQIHVYMQCLRDYFGVLPVFGIVTTYEEWRVCWLEDPILPVIPLDVNPAADAPQGAGEIERFFARVPSTEEETSPKPTPSEVAPQAAAQSHARESTLYVSEVYPFDHASLPMMLTTTMKLMASSRACIDLLRSTVDRTFLVISDKDNSWKSGAKIDSLEPMLECIISKPPRSNCQFYLVADMRGGLHGSVWLARTCSGTLHVLKFPVAPDLSDALHDTAREDEQRNARVRARNDEYAAWKRAYPQLCKDGYVCVRDLAVGPALVMPLFGHVSAANKLCSEISEVVATEVRRFASGGLSHDDLSWRHVGLYRDGGQMRCVLFDLALVTYEPHVAICPTDMLSRLGL